MNIPKIMFLLISCNCVYSLNLESISVMSQKKLNNATKPQVAVTATTNVAVNIREPESFVRYYIRKIVTNPDFYKILIFMAIMSSLKKSTKTAVAKVTEKFEAAEQAIVQTKKQITDLPSKTVEAAKGAVASVAKSVEDTAKATSQVISIAATSAAAKAGAAVVATTAKARSAAVETQAVIAQQAHEVGTGLISLMAPNIAQEILEEDLEKSGELKLAEQKFKEESENKWSEIRKDLESVRDDVEKNQSKQKIIRDLKETEIEAKTVEKELNELADDLLKQLEAEEMPGA